MRVTDEIFALATRAYNCASSEWPRSDGLRAALEAAFAAVKVIPGTDVFAAAEKESEVMPVAAPQPSINAEMLRVLGDIKVAELGSDENARWYVGVQTDCGCWSLRIEEPSAIEMFAEWKKSRDAIIAKAENAGKEGS